MKIPFDKMVKFMRIDDKESLAKVQNRVCRRIIKALVDGEKNSDVRNFECSFDDSRLYEFQWIERRSGFAHFVAFVEPKGLSRFVMASKKYGNDIGFDPLAPGGFQVTTEVFIYSPNSFPTKGLKSLLLKNADVVLVTTDEIIENHC